MGGVIRDGNNNPISAVYELNLKTKKIKPILVALNEDSIILCIDIIGKYLLIGGNGFNQVATFQDDVISDQRYDTTIPLIMMNLETHDVINVYDVTGLNMPRIINGTVHTKINKICICKQKRVITEGNANYFEYVALFGGNFFIDTTGISAGTNADIVTVGCLVIKMPVDETNPNFKLIARMYPIDNNLAIQVGLVVGIVPGLLLSGLPVDQFANVTSIICDEEEEGVEREGEENKKNSNTTTFYVGGYFNNFSVINYKGYEEATDAAAL